jgi:hypothetical protein
MRDKVKIDEEVITGSEVSGRAEEERKPAEATSSCGSEGKRPEETDSGSRRKLTGSPAEAQEMAEAGSLLRPKEWHQRSPYRQSMQRAHPSEGSIGLNNKKTKLQTRVEGDLNI